MTTINLPVGFSYSIGGFQGPKGYKTAISREELREYVKQGLTYKEVNERHPLSHDQYIKALDRYGLPRDSVRFKLRREENFQKLHALGYSVEEMAEMLNMKPISVKCALRRLDLEASRTTLLKNRRETILNMRTSGMSWKNIAEQLNTTVQNIKKAFDDPVKKVSKKTSQEIAGDLTKAQLIELKRQYVYPKFMGKAIGLSEPTIRKYMKFFGL